MADDADGLEAVGFDAAEVDPDVKALESVFKRIKTVYVFAIDCRPAMFDEGRCPVPGKTPMDLALGFVSRFLRSMLRDNNDLVGIVFYGTEKSKVKFGSFANVYEFQPVEPVSPQGVNTVAQLTASNVRDLCGSMSDQAVRELSMGGGLDQVMWYSHFMFSHSKTVKGDDSHRLWFLTNDVDPYLGNSEGKKRALIQVANLADKDHDIFIFPVAAPKQFDTKLFWQDLVDTFANKLAEKRQEPKQANVSIDEFAFDIGTDDYLSIVEQTRTRICPARRLATVPLVLGDGLELSCSLYAPVMIAKKPSPVEMESGNNLPITLQTKLICKTTLAHLTPDLIAMAAPVASKQVPAINTASITRTEMDSLKRFGPAGISLIGFKPRKTAVDPALNLHVPYLIRPDEKDSPGSTRAFLALMHCLLERDMVGIARCIMRAGSSPRLVALLPCVEQIDEETGRVHTPGGFWVIILPFANDIRTLEFPNEPLPEPDESSLSLAKALVETLNTHEFDPNNFENPVLQRFWSVLEDIAITDRNGSKIFDIVDDDTLQPPEALTYEDQLVALAQDFAASYGGPGDRATTKKRSAAGGPSAKESKAKQIRHDDSGGIDFAAMNAEDALNLLTLDQLKDYCRRNTLKLGGKKDELIARIRDHLAEEDE